MKNLLNVRVRIAIWLFLLSTGSCAWVLLRHGGEAARAWRSLLINFVYFTPLAAGLVTWSAIIIASKGRWAGQAERMTWNGIGFFLPSFIILAALWLGSSEWAPWYHAKLPQGLWLDNNFLFIRDAAGLLIFWGSAYWYLLTRRKGSQGAVFPAAILIVLYCLIFSLISFDLVMALDPQWHSAIFGGYFFISSLYLAVTFLGFLTVFDSQYSRGLRRDIGTLILAFSILTTYMVFIQLLTIWYENLPKETFYVVLRMNYSEWQPISGALIAVVYLGPLIMLMTTWAKTNRLFLGAVTLVILTGLWFERWWIITPRFASGLELGWVELAATAGVLGLFGLSFDLMNRLLPATWREKTQRDE